MDERPDLTPAYYGMRAVPVMKYHAIWHNGENVLMESDPIMQFFEYGHLRDDLKAVSQPFGELAAHIAATLPRNPERTVALRKLLESKDAAVRAALSK